MYWQIERMKIIKYAVCMKVLQAIEVEDAYHVAEDVPHLEHDLYVNYVVNIEIL